jgi:hypothetical protein
MRIPLFYLQHCKLSAKNNVLRSITSQPYLGCALDINKLEYFTLEYFTYQSESCCEQVV